MKSNVANFVFSQDPVLATIRKNYKNGHSNIHPSPIASVRTRASRLLYVQDSLNDFHEGQLWDGKAHHSPIGQRKIYRNLLTAKFFPGLMGGVGFVSPGTSYFGNGTTDYLKTPDAAQYNLGSGVWSMEMWMKVSGTTNPMFGQWVAEGTYGWLMNVDASNQIQLAWTENGTGSDTRVATGSESITQNQWVHVACQRVSGTGVRMYVDGNEELETMLDETFSNETVDLVIGGNADSGFSNVLKGYMDEMRMSDNVRSWGGGFTPPTVAYTSDGNTILLIHCDETIDSGTTGSGATFTESSGNAVTITEGGGEIRSTVEAKF